MIKSWPRPSYLMLIAFLLQNVAGDCKFTVLTRKAFDDLDELGLAINDVTGDFNRYNFNNPDSFGEAGTNYAFFVANPDFLTKYVVYEFTEDYIKAFLKFNDWFEVKECYFEYKALIDLRLRQSVQESNEVQSNTSELDTSEQIILDEDDLNLFCDLIDPPSNESLVEQPLLNEVNQNSAEALQFLNPFEELLRKLDEFRQNDIKERFKRISCGSESADWVVADENKDPVPEELKQYFKGTIWIHKCAATGKNLLINSFGSSSVTSDFDYSVFTYNEPESEVNLRHDYDEFIREKKEKLSLKAFKANDFDEIYFKHKSPATRLALLQAGMYDGKLNQLENIAKENIFFNMTITLDLIIRVNRSFKRAFKHPDEDTVLDSSYGKKVDSNSYPDVMVINMQYLREKPDISKGRSEMTKYYSSTMLSICHIAPYILKKNTSVIKIHGFDKFFEDCEHRMSMKLAGNRGLKAHKRGFFQRYPALINPNRNNISSCVMKAMRDPKNVDLYVFKTILSICHMLVDEAYLTLGALEFYKYSGDLDLFYCHTLIEAYIENMSMLIEHIKHFHDKADINKRDVSDKVSKYLKRAYEAITFPRCKDLTGNIIERPFFTGIEFESWFENVVINGTTFKPKEFSLTKEDPGFVKGISTERHEFLMNRYLNVEYGVDFPRPRVLDNILNIFTLARRLMRVRKATTPDIVDLDYEYLDDDRKKDLYLKHLVDMSGTLIEPIPYTHDDIDRGNTVGHLILMMQYKMKFTTIYILEKFRSYSTV